LLRERGTGVRIQEILVEPWRRRTPALRRRGTSAAAAMFGMTTRSTARESSRSKSPRNKLDGNGDRLPSDGCKKRKRAKPNGIGRRVLPERKAKKRNRGEGEHDDGSCSSVLGFN
jgi:hypothetical protein